MSSDIAPTNSKGKRRFIVHGTVTRYGPQSVASASGWYGKLECFSPHDIELKF